MFPFAPQRKDWTGDSAVLLVHGVGNARPGDYADLAGVVGDALDGGRDEVTVYELYYDVFNDWLNEKLQFDAHLNQVIGFITGRQAAGELADEAGAESAIGDVVGDVIWPLFSQASRAAVQTAYLAQLRQMVEDGRRSRGKAAGRLRFSIVCHSLGCFWTYETLHLINGDPTLNLSPHRGLTFQAVVFMASPVQLIRSLGQRVHTLVPGGLATMAGGDLSVPRSTQNGLSRAGVRRWVSVTGSMDPVGGHFLGRKANWAYMDVHDHEVPVEAVVDPQQLLPGQGTPAARLSVVLRGAVAHGGPPRITPGNPHSWLGYVERHEADLRRWLNA